MTTMLDKALIAARDARLAALDAKVNEQFSQCPVRTTWKPMAGASGAHVTERLDGKPMSAGQQIYVTGLWEGWGLLEQTLVRQQERARRR